MHVVHTPVHKNVVSKPIVLFHITYDASFCVTECIDFIISHRHGSPRRASNRRVDVLDVTNLRPVAWKTSYPPSGCGTMYHNRVCVKQQTRQAICVRTFASGMSIKLRMAITPGAYNIVGDAIRISSSTESTRLRSVLSLRTNVQIPSKPSSHRTTRMLWIDLLLIDIYHPFGFGLGRKLSKRQEWQSGSQ